MRMGQLPNPWGGCPVLTFQLALIEGSCELQAAPELYAALAGLDERESGSQPEGGGIGPVFEISPDDQMAGIRV
jgi:hypothetical protein